jgi:hypothetical protein
MSDDDHPDDDAPPPVPICHFESETEECLVSGKNGGDSNDFQEEPDELLGECQTGSECEDL